ncbi:hypothetical protein VOLCADRAFT_94061 [Volvox carteri f. nagariensis]|uniref:SRR1-like domain-containing protein n=1 Tax=Volvox carteri f. nagariensis TaxID=3068 RepID=D8U3T7_VOLCA|nr:uncharacterized protein VOLCADRAFT_94061 [Volvox carteri f. nagariensis]EFJ45668.1 hypothetical protein VOLCADRAFT_94061 [Volvox carteri f. nagariensis]|eukprot:XP_002953358.1 hypothetical protein VOLCADRAFT_94061 [Volvox carteri f. nagariensis]
MDVDDDGGWTIVRGKGKGRSRHKGTSSKRARDECCPGDGRAAGGACTDPGGPPFASWAGGPSTSFDRTAKRRTGRGGRGGERTPAEQCDQLLNSIRSCRQEVADSPFYARLRQVLAEAEAAGHLAHLSYFPPSTPYTSGGHGRGCVQRKAAGQDAVPSGTVVAVEMEKPQCCTASVGGVVGDDDDGDVVLGGLSSAVQLYDPAFDDIDRLALQHLGLQVGICAKEAQRGYMPPVLTDPPQVLEVDEGGGRKVTEPTFFYMPHCEGELYDTLLRANWSTGAGGRGGDGAPASRGTPPATGTDAVVVVGVPLVALLGNSFRQYLERWEMRLAGSGGAGGGSRKAQEAHKARPLASPGPVVRCCLAAGERVHHPTDEHHDEGGETFPGPTNPHLTASLLASPIRRGAVVELATPDLGFPVASAFNSTALHLFPLSYKLDRLLSEGPDAAVADGDGL